MAKTEREHHCSEKYNSVIHIASGALTFFTLPLSLTGNKSVKSHNESI